MSRSSSTTRKPHRSSIPSWRNQTPSKNSSPARLSYVLAEPEHSVPLVSAKAKLPVSVLCQEPEEQESKASVDLNDDQQPLTVNTLRQRPMTKSLGLARPGRAASEYITSRGHLISPSPASRRTTRAAHPALLSMAVRAPEKKAVTLLESPVSVNGHLNIPMSAKGKTKDVSGQEDLPTMEQEHQKLLEIINPDPSSVAPFSNTAHDEIPSPPHPSSGLIPSTAPASAAHITSSDFTAKHDSTSSMINSKPTSVPIPPSDPIIDADPSGLPSSDLPTQPTQSENSINMHVEASPPKATTVSSASSIKEGSSWFATSWLGWSSSASNSVANPPVGGSRDNDGFLTSEHRAKPTGKTRDRDGGDIDRQGPGQDNINSLENVRERSQEGDVTCQVSPTLVDDGADNASMSITHGERDGKTATHGNCLPSSTKVERQNPTPASTEISVQAPHVDKPSTDPGPAVDISATSTAMSTPQDATAVSAPATHAASDSVPSASGLTNGGTATTTVQDSREPQTQLGTVAQASSSSWWDYIGWKSAAAPTAVPDDSTSTAPAVATASASAVHSSEGDTAIDLGQNSSAQKVTSEGTVASETKKDAQSRHAPTPPLSPIDSEPKGPKSGSASVPSDEEPMRELAHAQESQPEQTQALVQEAEPPHHDQAQNAAAGSWYNPWSWYGSSPNPTVADTPSAGESRANEERDNGEKIEEQSQKAGEGNQRSQTPQPEVPQVSVTSPTEEQPRPASPTAPTPGASNNVVVEHNPISATIDSHRASWLSFFASTSSRALITKTITAPPVPGSTSVGGGSLNNNVKVDENGMEVMLIDDEAESPAFQVSQSQEPPASQASQAQLPLPDSSKPKEGTKDKDSKALPTVASLSPAQGLVATLVRGRGRVRNTQVRIDTDKDSLKDGLNSDASSIRSGVGGQRSGAATPVNGTPIPPKPGVGESAAGGAGSVSSSPASTTVSLVKKASLSLTGKASTATIPNGNATTADSASTSNTTATTNTNTASPPTTTATVSANGKISKSKSVSPTPSPTSKKPAPSPPLPNLVLPSWQDTFHTAPRSIVPHRAEAGALTKTVQYVSGWLFSGGRSGMSGLIGGGSGRKGREASKAPETGKRKASSAERGRREREREFMHFGTALPKAWDILNSGEGTSWKDDVLRGSRRVVVIGVHGWFPGAVMRTVIGEPTGTSTKLANMMIQALKEFENEHGIEFEKVTKIPLEGEGTVKHRVEKLYSNLLGNKEWMDDLKTADAILMATHSQGSVVSAHLLDRLIADKHIRTTQNSVVLGPASSFPAAAGMETAPALKRQRICCLAMCGIHLGPLKYLSTSSLFQPYIQYLESPAARELFEFQNTNSDASKEYVKALRSVLSNGVKMLYAASLNDQVVPIYSGLFTAASHPLILRALYIDGDAYNSSDFLANLLVLLLRILNSGIPDSGLLVHLSEATAGSLNGVGHSTPYEETAIYSLAVKYLFLTNDGLEEHPELILDPFNARQEQNDYEIPWALRDVIANERVAYFFSKEIVQLRDAFREWHPRTSILRDLKRKLQPIQRLPASFAASRL